MDLWMDTILEHGVYTLQTTTLPATLSFVAGKPEVVGDESMETVDLDTDSPTGQYIHHQESFGGGGGAAAACAMGTARMHDEAEDNGKPASAFAEKTNKCDLLLDHDHDFASDDAFGSAKRFAKRQRTDGAQSAFAPFR